MEEKRYYYKNGTSLMDLDEPLEILPEGCVQITEKEFNEEYTRLRTSPFINHANNSKRIRIFELKQLLAESDYKQAKWKDGDMTDEEYEPIRQQRHAWRVEINQIEEELENE